MSERKEQEMTENDTGAGRRGRIVRDTVTGKFLSPEVAAVMPAENVVWEAVDWPFVQVRAEHVAMRAVLEQIADGHEHPSELAAEMLALLRSGGTEGTGEGL